jgi:3-oxoacyl-[acyl-carrier protein] reductase
MIRSRWGASSTVRPLPPSGQLRPGELCRCQGWPAWATKSLAREAGSRGITVNALAPGVIVSPTTQAFFDDAASKREISLGHPGTPGEVAYLADFLASDRAAYISGQTLSINGAMA